MILVDSSVWIDFFGARATPETDLLKESLPIRRILTADLVLMEVLQGARDDRQFGLMRGLLLNLDVITVSDEQVALTAAANYRALRALGITVRKTIDTLIATRCILDRTLLLYRDRDFQPFVDHLGLRSAMAYFRKAS